MIRFPTETLDARAARLAPWFTIVLPQGQGPFPVCVMLHGCGKADGPQPGYARALAAAGVASVMVDSFSPRGIDRTLAVSLVCTGLRLQGRRRTGDLAAALHWVRAQPWSDQDRLAAAGWSHGGWTVMDALAVTPDIGRLANLSDAGPDVLAGLRHAFAVYPWCGPGAQTIRKGWATPVSATIVIAGRDTVSGSALPQAAAEAARRSGADVHVALWPEATHSFDERGVADPRFRFDHELVAATHALCAEHIARAVGS